jgi:Integrase core domain
LTATRAHVGSASGRDFPSALVRLLRCLGIAPQVCPPHRPDRNAFVERYHRTYNAECLRVERPQTVEAVRAVTAAFLTHYNWVRPNQARSCRNRPPRVAYPTLPTLPHLPEGVDPDRWLEAIDGQAFARSVQPNGNVLVDLRPSSIRQALAGHQVVLVVRAAERVFDVWLGRERLKAVPIKGLYGQRLPFEQYAERMQEEARSDYRRWLYAHQHTGQPPRWTAAGSG